jgi:aminoglycoside phosphotransferase (APT) family kinase protein
MRPLVMPRMDEPRRAALQAWLPNGVAITAMSLMSGGAIQQNWRMDVTVDGVAQAWVLRTDAAATLVHSRPRAEEFALLLAAHDEGVAVPEPLFLCTDASVIGAAFFVMRRVEGTAAARQIVRGKTPGGETLGGGRVALTAALGRQLARIHRMRPGHAGLGFLAPHPPVAAGLRFVAEMRGHLDRGRQARPILEWGLRHLERRAAPPGEIVLCHNDFRTGNYMVTDQGITGVLDWEFAGWGDRHEDLGWLCARCWRFGSLHEAGGVGSRAELYGAYEAEAGHAVDDARVRYWEIAATIRWAVIALSQAERHLSGEEPSLELALTGHIVPELELDVMRATT